MSAEQVFESKMCAFTITHRLFRDCDFLICIFNPRAFRIFGRAECRYCKSEIIETSSDIDVGLIQRTLRSEKSCIERISAQSDNESLKTTYVVTLPSALNLAKITMPVWKPSGMFLFAYSSMIATEYDKLYEDNQGIDDEFANLCEFKADEYNQMAHDEADGLEMSCYSDEEYAAKIVKQFLI